jgi:hypothetical protein
MDLPIKAAPTASIKVSSYPDRGLAEENKGIIWTGIDAFYSVIHRFMLPVLLFGGLAYFFWMLYVVDFSSKSG